MGFVLIAGGFIACEKAAPYDEAGQMAIDDAIIVQYMKDSSVVATKDPSGLYYQILKTGKDDGRYDDTTTIWASFSAKILKDSLPYDRSLDSTFKFNLPGYMPGWKKGVELAKLEGKVRLLIPSPLAYQQRTVTGGLKTIPPNSILDITLEILSIHQKPKSNK